MSISRRIVRGAWLVTLGCLFVGAGVGLVWASCRQLLASRLESSLKGDLALLESEGDSSRLPDAIARFSPDRRGPLGGNAELHFLVGKAYWSLAEKSADAQKQLGFLDRSYCHIDRACLLQPVNACHQVWLAKLLGAFRKTRQSQQRVGLAIRLAPQDAYIRHVAGNIYLRARQFEQAAEQFRVCLELDPRRLPDILAGFIQGGLRYDTYVKLLPLRAEILSETGRFLKERHRAQEARLALEKAVELYLTQTAGSPASAEAYVGLGRTYVLLGKLEEGARHYRKALQIRPQARIWYFELARAYEQAGRLQKALEVSDECLRMGPYRPAQQVRERMKTKLDRQRKAALKSVG